MKFLREIESERIIRFILVTSILLLIFSFILSFPIVLFLQDLFYFSYDHLLFIRPEATFKGFSYGLIWISLSLLSFLFTKMYAEKKERPYKGVVPHIISLVLAIILCFLSLHHYYYIEENRVTENKFFSLSENTLYFTDVKHVKREVAENNYEVLSYTFQTDTKEMTIPYDSKDVKTSRTLYYLIEKYRWEVEDQFVKK